MERITLYHHGTPITRHALQTPSFSIGTNPENDLVLTGDGVRERHLIFFRGERGRWRAQLADHAKSRECDLSSGTRISLGAYSVEMEADDGFDRGMDRPSLDWAGVSPAIRLLRIETERLAPLKAPVLVSGESGTGKELVAAGLHALSCRRREPFVAVNCGGLTESLLEDTLFGHEKGAFTGAGTARKGVFEQADKGTLFLDEIGELPLTQQASLLRVLEDKAVCPIGAGTPVPTDFRLVAATNRDLEKCVSRGQFRLDLYHRITTLKLATTPLRHRPEDVEPLVRHFLREMGGEFGPRDITEKALLKLSSFSWPGNVRELRNVLYRALALTDRYLLNANHFDISCKTLVKPVAKLNRVPVYQLRRFLESHDNNISSAAKALGVPRTTLRDYMSRYKADTLKAV